MFHRLGPIGLIAEVVNRKQHVHDRDQQESQQQVSNLQQSQLDQEQQQSQTNV
jgi:hypothetical protein